jgi:hypothetical protein
MVVHTSDLEFNSSQTSGGAGPAGVAIFSHGVAEGLGLPVMFRCAIKHETHTTRCKRVVQLHITACLLHNGLGTGLCQKCLALHA